MIKRTLYFGNPAYLSMRNDQLVVKLPEVEKDETLPDTFKKDTSATIPVEDIGVVILDHRQITLTQALIEKLLSNNIALITCNSAHLPTGLMLPLSGNTIQTERFKSQINASEPLKKNLWQQTVEAKISNQAVLLQKLAIPVENMQHWVRSVKSGDTGNHEARAAAYYWDKLFSVYLPGFRRFREGEPPNNLLNYGYAILRAIVARALTGSGLLPTLGIHHRNKYNAYCLADDIMEPYRPFVDAIVLESLDDGEDFTELGKSLKTKLLDIASTDVVMNNERSPLMVATQKTSASLVRCFEGQQRKIAYPEMSL